MVEDEESNKAKKLGNGSISSTFMHADGVDAWLMALGLIGAIFDGLSDTIPLFFLNPLFNSIANASSLDAGTLQHHINQYAVKMLYLCGAIWVACFLEGYCWTRTGERQAARMRVRYLKAVLRQDLAYFNLNTTATSQVITGISNDSLVIQEAISEKVPNFVSRVTVFIGNYIAAFILLRKLAMVGLPFAVLLAVPGWLCGTSLLDLSGKVSREYAKAGSIAEQALSSIRTVYAFVGETKTVAKFSEALNGSTKLGLKLGLVKGLAIGSNGTIFAIWAILSYYGSRLVLYDGAQGGTVYCAGIGIVYGGLALGSGLTHLKDIAEACSASKRIMEMINRVPEIDSDKTEGIILEHVSGRVEFKNVNFAYPSRPESVVFKNFCLTIPAGKTVALVGTSGSGKSTALSLLQRFYDPLNGEILLDGVAIDKLQLKWLRSQMALVSQEPSLFSTTIKENIIFGKEDALLEDVIQAAKACDAHNFISQLPQGYDTQVGERGIQLSGGQKQRIAIARAIIRKPPLLLLDEATSALDSESERAVQEAIDKVSIGKTTIIIAHRLSTIKKADAIAIVENGQVEENGSHEELTQCKNGLYSSLLRLQQLKEQNNTKESNNSLFIASNLEEPSLADKSQLNLIKSGDSVVRVSALDHNGPTPSFWRLLCLNKTEWKQASLGCMSAIFFGAVQPLYSVVIGSMIPVYFSRDHNEIKEKIRFSSLCFFGLSVFTWMINIIQHYNFGYMGVYLTKRIRERMLSKILTFEVGWFDTEGNSSSVICSTLAKDANAVRSLVGDRISLLVQATSAVAVAWIIGLVIAWRLATVSIAAQPLIIACFYTRRVLLKNMAKKAIKAQDESTKLAAEAVTNIPTVTAFSSQRRIVKMLEKTQQNTRRESIRQSWFAGILLGCSVSIANLNWCLNFWYGGKLLYEGHIPPRAVFQTVIVVLSTGRVIAEAGSMTSDLAKGWDAIRSVFDIMDRDTSINPESSKSYEPKTITGHVELCDIHFAYPARPNVMIFQGFSINIEGGNSTALVGKSGSGKSTIIGLIERFYDPLRGVVKIDGRDLKSYHLRSLRKFIALVNQEPTLFAGTIKDNILYGSSGDVTESEIIEAARAANAHDFISRQKDGYETWCGDRGLQLSGGEKQRIAIARAILGNPIILLLDEATSALDSQSEKIVQEAVERMMIGRTSVVVAHRLSTIQNCHQIAVLDNGKMVEKGTHSSLMAKGLPGAYHSLVSLQTTHSNYAYP
ncbi:hypothetical protein UlMin_041602 [Ulmus minor]